MKCKKCNSINVTTPSINYSYYCKKDKYYFKVCPFCKTELEGKSDVECNSCGAWLPNFPTSWVRSVTNIYTLRKIAEMVGECSNGICSDDALAKILAAEKLVTVDPIKLEKDGVSYWTGGPRRRASEYTANLRFLGLASKSNTFTRLNYSGIKFSEVKTKLEFNATCARIFFRLRITNKYDIRGSYSEYKIRPIFLMLKIIKDLADVGKEAYLENMALAVMSRDEKVDYKRALNYSIEYDRSFLYKTFFSEGKEYRRVVQGVFSHWMEQIGLIERENIGNTIKIKITEVGKKILNFYETMHSSFEYNKDEALVKLMEYDDGVLPFDVEYDFSDSDIKYLNEKLGDRSKLLKNIMNRSIDEELKALEDIISIHSTAYEKKVLSLKVSSAKNAFKSGQEWEEEVYRSLEELNLSPKWYKKEKTFAHIVLSDEILNSLTGGTGHNPDIILFEPIILVDPKKDVNIEMYKVSAYDKYATDINVDANALIVSSVLMKPKLAERLKKLKRTSVIDKFALDVVVNNKDFFHPNLVRKLFGVNRSNGEYVSEEFVFDFVEKQSALV